MASNPAHNLLVRCGAVNLKGGSSSGRSKGMKGGKGREGKRQGEIVGSTAAAAHLEREVQNRRGRGGAAALAALDDESGNPR